MKYAIKKQHCINRDRNSFQFSIDFKSDLSHSPSVLFSPQPPKQFSPNAVHNHKKKDDSKVCCGFYHCSPQNSSAETGNSGETLTRPPDYSSSWHRLHRHGLCFTSELSTVALDFTVWPDAEGKAHWPTTVIKPCKNKHIGYSDKCHMTFRFKGRSQSFAAGIIQ